MPSQLTFDDVEAAVRNGSVEAIFTELLKGAAPSGKNLSKLGFDTNAVDPDDGNTLMHVACGTGNLESARYLRKVGSDVNRFNDVGYTPLCCCILKAKSMGVNNALAVVQFLVKNGADVDKFTIGTETDVEGGGAGSSVSLEAMARTPLQITSGMGFPKITAYLLQAGADTSLSGYMGITAMHLACMFGNTDDATILFQNGANFLGKDDHGRTAVEVAVDGVKGHIEKLVASKSQAPVSAVEDDPNDGSDTETFAGLGDDSDGEMSNGGEFDDVPKSKAASKLAPTPQKEEALLPSEGLQPLEEESPLLLEVFQGDTMAKFVSPNWKLREEALLEAEIRLGNWKPNYDVVEDDIGFEAFCTFIIRGLSDKVPQVCFASLTLLKSLFASSTLQVPSNIGLSKEGEGSNLAIINDVVQTLLTKMSSSHERTAAEAFKAVHVLATRTSLGPAVVVFHLLKNEGGSDLGSTHPKQKLNPLVSWRPVFAKMKLVSAFLKEYGFSSRAGLDLELVLKHGTEALGNASVKVRQAAIDVIANALVLEHTQNKVPLDDMFIDYFGRLKSSLKASLLSAIQSVAKAQGVMVSFGELEDEVMTKGSKKSRHITDSTSSDQQRQKSSKKKSRSRSKKSRSSKDSERGSGSSGNGAGGMDGGDADFSEEHDEMLLTSEMPYAEPLSEELAYRSKPISDFYGEVVARCLFSSAWAARDAALQRIGASLRQGHWAGDKAEMFDVDVLVRLQGTTVKVIKSALRDKVMNVYLTALTILEQITQPFMISAQKRRQNNKDGVQSAGSSILHQNTLTHLWQLLGDVIWRLGDTKQKAREASEGTMMMIAKKFGCDIIVDALEQSAGLGDESVNENMPPNSSPIKTSKKESGLLVAGRLDLISHMIGKFGLKEQNDEDAQVQVMQFGDDLEMKKFSSEQQDSKKSEDKLPKAAMRVSLSKAMACASKAIENRDKRARTASVKVFEAAFKRCRKEALPFLHALPPISQRKVLTSLVDSGVLEKEMLEENAEDFDFAEAAAPGMPARPFSRSGFSRAGNRKPGTSSGRPRPGTGSYRPRPPGTGAAGKGSVKENCVEHQKLGVYVKPEPLPFSNPLNEEQKVEHEKLIGIFGEDVLRCMMDRAWTSREAALREVEARLVAAGGGDDAGAGDAHGKLPPGQPSVLMQTSELLDIALMDTVGRVFQTALRVLQSAAADYLPTIKGGEHLARAALQGPIQTVVNKLSDSKERVRVDSAEVLQYLASLPSIGPNFIAIAITDVASPSQLSASSSLKILSQMVREFSPTSAAYLHSANRKKNGDLDLRKALQYVVPCFENKHVDVRNEAAQVFIAIYETTNGGDPDLDLQGCLATLKPVMREVINESILQFNAANNLEKQPDLDPHTCPTGASRVQSVDSGEVTRLFGDSVAKKLSSINWQSRRDGIYRVVEKLTGKLDSQESRMTAQQARDPKLWELCVLLAKQGLLDVDIQPRLAAFDVLHVLSNPKNTSSGGRQPLVFPWDDWNGRLVLGSLVKTIVTQLGDSMARIRAAATEILMIMAKQHDQGLAIVTRELLTCIDCPALPSRFDPNFIYDQKEVQAIQEKRESYASFGRQLTSRLQLILVLLGERTLPPSSAPFSMDSILQFVPYALKHRSALVQRLAVDLTSVACEMGGGAVEVGRFLTRVCDRKSLPILEQLCQKLVPGFETGVPRNSRPAPVTGGGGGGGSHCNNIQASPIRTRQVQKIRSTRNDEDYGGGGGGRSPARFEMDGSRGGAIQGVFSNADNENENAANFMMADGGSGGQNYGGGRYKNEQHDEYGNDDGLSSSHVKRIQSMSKPWSVPNHQNKPFTPNSVRQPPQSANAEDKQHGRGGSNGNHRYPDQPLIPPAKAMWDSPRGNEFEVRTTNDGGFVMSQDNAGQRNNSSKMNSPIWLSEENNFQNDVRDGGFRDSSENITVGSKGLLRAKQARRPSRNKSSHSQQVPENGDDYDFGQRQNEESYVVGGARGVASLRKHRS